MAKDGRRVTKDPESPLMVRGVNKLLWRKARVKALEKDISMGDVINELLQAWFDGKVEVKGGKGAL